MVAAPQLAATMALPRDDVVGLDYSMHAASPGPTVSRLPLWKSVPLKHPTMSVSD
jgi:hypothetical protein